ncbi:ATP-dependent helicase, partial [Streptomyces mirabilis]
AQAPSGIAVTITAPVVERPRRGSSSPSRGRRGHHPSRVRARQTGPPATTPRPNSRAVST